MSRLPDGRVNVGSNPALLTKAERDARSGYGFPWVVKTCEAHDIENYNMKTK